MNHSPDKPELDALRQRCAALEAELKQNREAAARYRELFDTCPAGLGVANLQGELQAFNDAMLRPGNYTREDIEQIRNVAALYADPQQREEVLALARSQGYVDGQVVQLKRKDGSTYDARMSLRPTTIDGQRGWLAMVEDVTEQQQAAEVLNRGRQELETLIAQRTEDLQREVEQRVRMEETLRGSEANWRSLLEHAPDFILSVDRDGKILLLNRTVPGQSMEQAIGSSLYNYVPPDTVEALRENLQAVFATGKPRTYEAQALGPHGTQSWYQSRLGPVIHDGQVEAVIIIATDITLRKQAELALQQEQQLLKELLKQQENDRQLVAYEIHDGLMQYTTGALMRLESLGDSVDMPLSQVEGNLAPAIEMLRKSIREGRRLISGLRPMILDEAGIVAAIDYLIGEWNTHGQKISFEHDVNGQRYSPLVESALFRICQEALTNARKHSQSPTIEVQLTQQGDMARLVVTDRGIGFDPADVDAKSFGLQGIRERARLMGGSAQIETSAGGGTTVTVEMPTVPTV